MWSRGMAGIIMLGLTSCVLGKDPYGPALPAERRTWDNKQPFMLERQVSLSELLGQSVCPTPVALPPPRLPSIVPSQDEWERTWRSVPKPRQVCSGTGRKRVCKTVRLSVAEQAKQGALIKPARRYMDKGMSGRMRYPFTPGADHIYEIPVGVISPTYLILPPGKRSARVMKLHSDYWDVSYVQIGEGAHRHEQIALVGLEEGYEAHTAIELQSGESLWLKLIATHDAGLMSVSWDFPPPAKPDVMPVAHRPPTINRDRIHSAYVLEQQGKITPPWMPEGIFDDGTRTYIYFKEPLTYTRAPAVFAIDQTGKVQLTQSHMFLREGAQEAGGTYLMVQGLWPALKLQDSAGIAVTFKRHNPHTQGPASYDRH